MRKKDLIYFASAALLLSVSAQVAKADEVTSNEPVTADNNHQQVAPSVETKNGRKSLSLQQATQLQRLLSNLQKELLNL